MKAKKIIKITIDTAMLILLPLLMACHVSAVYSASHHESGVAENAF